MREATHVLLQCGNQIGLMKQAVDEMYRQFLDFSTVTIDNQNDRTIYLADGKAISPAQAAHCLLEMKRTAIFLRGIHQAIEDKLQYKRSTPLAILYAGTGPYATLLTPLLHLFKPSEIQVDLMDINPVSNQSACDVFRGMGFGPFVNQVFEGVDATTFEVKKPYDIVISETMQAVLKKEPQVAIMQNLIRQLPPNAVFIPQQIVVDAALESRGRWNPETNISEGVERMELGRVMTVDRMHLNPEQFRSSVEIPSNIDACTTLKLFTTIQVYADHVLGENDCSLNIPYKLCDATGMEGDTLDFWYEQGEVPHICCRSARSLKLLRAQGRPDRKPQEMYESHHA